MLPDGAVLRLQFEERPPLAVGEVIAFRAGTGVTVHRIVGRGWFGPARSFVLTRGDASLLVDHPVPTSAILGVVREWNDGRGWRRVPVDRAIGWRYVLRQTLLGPVLVALHGHYRLAMALTVTGFTLRAIVQKVRAVGRP
jgi:hypothetical protein